MKKSSSRGSSRSRSSSTSRSGGKKYGSLASKKVEKAMHEYKRGELKSGRSGAAVKSRKQAIAIGLSEARRKGGKVPARKSGGRARKSA